MKQFAFGIIKDSQDLISANRRKLFEKSIYGIVRLQVGYQRVGWHTGAAKDGRASEDMRITVDDRAHGIDLHQ